MKIKKEKVGQVVKKKYTHDLADDYMQLAFDTIEEIKRLGKKRSVRRKVISSCVLSFLSLEASINRLFFVTFNTGIQPIVQPNIPKTIVDHIKTNWRRFSIKEKFLLLPPLVSDFQFDVSIKPFNLFNEFVLFRNQLVHTKSWESEHSILITNANVNDEGRGSWGGKTLKIESLQEAANNYKFANFSKTIEDLKLEDAEKCLEIACWMRLELSKTKKISQPIFNFDPPIRNISSYVGPDIIDKFLTRHFK